MYMAYSLPYSLIVSRVIFGIDSQRMNIATQERTICILTSNENATPKSTSISQGYVDFTFTENFWWFYEYNLQEPYRLYISFNVKCPNIYTHAHIPTVVKWALSESAFTSSSLLQYKWSRIISYVVRIVLYSHYDLLNTIDLSPLSGHVAFHVAFWRHCIVTS